MAILDITQQDPRWPNALDFHDAMQVLIQKCKIAETYEVSLLLTDDAQIQQLNAQYRGKDTPTNVLSFPQDTPPLLGDVVMAYETIMQEAKAQQKHVADHATHLLIHGILHLLGYDHEEDEEAQAMEALEIAILAELSIANPYQ